MGQAKQRGTREQRVAEGIVKRQAQQQAFEEAKKAALASLTPTQQQKLANARAMLAMLSGLTSSIS